MVLRLFLCSVCNDSGCGELIVFMIGFVGVGCVIVVIVCVWWLDCCVVCLVFNWLLGFGFLVCWGCSWRCVVG